MTRYKCVFEQVTEHVCLVLAEIFSSDNMVFKR